MFDSLTCIASGSIGQVYKCKLFNPIYIIDTSHKNIKNIMNENNISIVPKCIDKKHAVQYLIEKNRPKLTIGIGDSLSDWNFMDICHIKILPQKSQINKTINQLKF